MAAHEAALGPDGRVEGRHMPEICVVVEGPEAAKQPSLPGVVQYVLSSATAKKRNQYAIRIPSSQVTGADAVATMEGMIQSIGAVRHVGFSQKEQASEGLARLDPSASAP